MPQGFSEQLLGHIGVDAGCVVVGDPCYLVEQDELPWTKVVDSMYDSKGHEREGVNGTSAHEINGTFITSTPNGDGQFPVYVETDGSGQITSIRIDLVDEPEMCDGCDWPVEDCTCDDDDEDED